MRLVFVLSLLTSLVTKVYALDLETYRYMKDNHYEYLDRLVVDEEKGTIRAVNPNIIEILEASQRDIQEAANHFPDVKASTIAACIASENTMNVQVDDDVQNFLAANANPLFEITSTLLGKDPKDVSVGLGQINVRAALEGEPLLAEIEERKQLTEWDEVAIRKRLQTYDGAFMYAGAIIQNAINKYKEIGFDISDDPGMQCTLYNIGEIDSRVQRAKEKMAEDDSYRPRVNYFGFFVNQHFENEFKKFDGEVEVPENKPEQVPVMSWRSQRLNLETPLEAFSMPPKCQESSANTEADHSVGSGVPSRTVEGRYRVIGFGMGCGLKAYTSIQLHDGRIAWVRSLDLQENSINLSQEYPLFEVQPQLNECMPENELKACLQNLGTSVENPSAGLAQQFEMTRKPIIPIIPRKYQISRYLWEQGLWYLNDAKDYIKYNLGINDWNDPKNTNREKFDEFYKVVQDCFDNTTTGCTSNVQSRRLEEMMYELRYGLRQHSGYSGSEQGTNQVLNEFFKELEEIEIENAVAPATGGTDNSRMSMEEANNVLMLSQDDKDYLFNYIEFAKENYVRSYNRDKPPRERLLSWDHEDNPHREIFNEFEKIRYCETCFLRGGSSMLYLIDAISRLTRTNVSLGGGTLEEILRYKADDLEEKKDQDNWYKYLLVSVIRHCNASTSESSALSSLIKAHRMISREPKETLNNISESDKQKMIVAANNLIDECTSNFSCKSYYGYEENIDCLQFTRPYDIQFYCRFAFFNQTNKLDEHMQQFSCLFTTHSDQYCYENRADTGIAQLEKAADLDCVKQILTSESVDMDSVLKISTKENLKNKMSFINSPKAEKTVDLYGDRIYDNIFDYNLQFRPVCPEIGP